MFDPLVIAFGLGVGVLIGLTGIGGGSLMTPLLILVVGIKPVVAIGTDLAYGAITKTVGGWKHLKMGTVDLGVTAWLAVGSLPGALGGVILVDRLHEAYGDGFDTILLAVVAGALLIVAAAIILRTVILKPRELNETDTYAFTTRRRKLEAAAIGLVLGAMLGATSVGSGALIGPVLILLFRLTPRRVVGTDVAHAALLLWVAGVAHWVGGNVDFALMGNILIGSIPGVWIGTSLVPHVPVAGLRPTLGCVLLGSALGVLTKAGVDLPVWAILGAPLATGAVAWGLHRYRLRLTPREIVVPA
jgi:uncharacterized membrane protein YfcA